MIHPPYRSPAPPGERNGGNAGQRKLEPCANESGTSSKGPDRVAQSNEIQPIMIATKTTRIGPRTAAGEILLSHNHIALLHGLYDRPGGRVSSRAEWVRAAWPYADRIRPAWTAWGIRGSMITMHVECVKQKRRGRFVEATLTDVGRGIVERKIRARIRGRGAYEGLSSVDADAFAAQRSRVSNAAISDAVNYAEAYGLPLLVNDPSKRPNGRVFAVSTGLGKPFRILCFEELEQRGPRRLHWEWTRDMIDADRIPHGYEREFPQYQHDDILCYLKELEENELDFQMYAKVYFGQSLLSQQKTSAFLDEEIDLTETDFAPEDLKEYVRRESPTYSRALGAVESLLSWIDPETNTNVGKVFTRKTEFSTEDIVVTTPAALSCLQQEWDAMGIGLTIETRYVLE